MIKFVLKAIANSGAIYLADNIVEGFTFSGDLFILAGMGLALAAFHSFVYPIVKILAFPLVLLSLGFFGFAINIAVLWGLSFYVSDLTIEGILPLIWGAAVLAAANWLLSWL